MQASSANRILLIIEGTVSQLSTLWGFYPRSPKRWDVVSGFWPRSAKGRDVVSGFWPRFPNGWDVALTSFTLAPLTARAERHRERASARAREEIGRKIGSCDRRESMFWSFFCGFVFFFFSRVLDSENCCNFYPSREGLMSF
jgi:hypothetical protein